MSTRKLLLASLLILVSACSTSQNPTDERARVSEEKIEKLRVTERVAQASQVFNELISGSDAGMPKKLLTHARCVAVLPEVLKGAFVVGGRYGKGIVSCMDDAGTWSAPAFIELSAASVGWQIGAQATDLVLVVTGKDARKAMLQNNITLGADLSVSAGPVGRSGEAKTDFTSTGIFSYARNSGLFAGISLEGAVLRPDTDSNANYYGKELTSIDILLAQADIQIPQGAQEFMRALP